MDLGKLKEDNAQEEEGLTFTVYRKNGEPYRAADGSECTLTVLGEDSKSVRDVFNSLRRRAQKQRVRELTPEEMDRRRVELAVAAVTGWHGWEAGEQPAPCTPENLRQLFGERHILEQAEAKIAGHADFFGSKETN